MSLAGKLVERVAFDRPDTVDDGLGGRARSWVQDFDCNAEFRYQKGSEEEDAGGHVGVAEFKVRVRSSSETRRITSEYRMRDVKRSVAYNLREVDNVSDRHWVWFVAENGIAI